MYYLHENDRSDANVLGIALTGISDIKISLRSNLSKATR